MNNQENNKEAKKSESCEKVVYEEQISNKNNELNQFQQEQAQIEAEKRFFARFC